MNHIFDISPANFIAEQTNLFIEISDEGLIYFLQDDNTKIITGLNVLHFNKNNIAPDVADNIKNIFQQQSLTGNIFKKVVACFSFNESLLVPEIYYNENETAGNFNLVYGDLHQGIILADHVVKKKIYNTFRIPHAIYQALYDQFPGAKFYHQYSTLLNQLEEDTNILQVIFYKNKVIMLLSHQGNVQLVQTFKYITSTDVIYHMLNICEQFKPERISVKISGIIEKDSALSREMYKYFHPLDFDKLPGDLLYDDRIKALPNHYFSHLFSIALCG